MHLPRMAAFGTGTIRFIDGYIQRGCNVNVQATLGDAGIRPEAASPTVSVRQRTY